MQLEKKNCTPNLHLQKFQKALFGDHHRQYNLEHLHQRTVGVSPKDLDHQNLVL